MNDTNNVLIESISEFIDNVSKQIEKWKKEDKEKDEEKEEDIWCAPWFRGEDSINYSTVLQPKLYRHIKDIKKLLEYEGAIRLEFKRCATQLMTDTQPKDRWEWYFLMQHYGAPTRLLDWSDGALVGLYFAVVSRGDKKREIKDTNAAVYMLGPRWLNGQTFKQTSLVSDDEKPDGVALPEWEEANYYLSEDELENEMELGVDYPLAIDPSHFSRRFAAQRSRFTIFGRDKDWLKSQSGEKGSRLITFEIKNTSILKIRQELKLSGISESTIFPDLEGLGREMRFWLGELCTEGGSIS